MGLPGRVEIDRPHGDGVWVIALHGDYGCDVRPTLDEALASADAARTVVVDLSAARFIDSSVLMALARRRDAAIVAPSGGFPRKLLDAWNGIGRERTFDSTHEALRGVAVVEKPGDPVPEPG